MKQKGLVLIKFHEYKKYIMAFYFRRTITLITHSTICCDIPDPNPSTSILLSLFILRTFFHKLYF